MLLQRLPSHHSVGPTLMKTYLFSRTFWHLGPSTFVTLTVTWSCSASCACTTLIWWWWWWWWCWLDWLWGTYAFSVKFYTSLCLRFGIWHLMHWIIFCVSFNTKNNNQHCFRHACEQKVLVVCIVLFLIFETGNYGKVFKGSYRDNSGCVRNVAVKVGKLCYQIYPRTDFFRILIK